MGANFNLVRNDNTNANAKKTAAMYLNLSIELPDGTKLQLGEKGVALYAERRSDAAHIKRLTEGGDEALQGLLKKLRISIWTPGNQPDVTDVGY